MRLRPAASWQAIQQGMAVTSPKPISERGIPAWSEQGTYAQQECGVSYFQTNPFLTHTHTHKILIWIFPCISNIPEVQVATDLATLCLGTRHMEMALITTVDVSKITFCLLYSKKTSRTCSLF